MPIGSHQYRRVQVGGSAYDGRLLETTGPASQYRHLLTHYDIAVHPVVGNEGKCFEINLELVKLTYFVVIAGSHSFRKIGGNHTR
jgi:hypothetical protein